MAYNCAKWEIKKTKTALYIWKTQVGEDGPNLLYTF